MDGHWLKSVLCGVTPGHSQELLINRLETRITKRVGCRNLFGFSIVIQKTTPKLKGLRQQPYHYLSQFGDWPGIKGEVLLPPVMTVGLQPSWASTGLERPRWQVMLAVGRELRWGCFMGPELHRVVNELQELVFEKEKPQWASVYHVSSCDFMIGI